MHPGDQPHAARAETAEWQTTAPVSGQLRSPASPDANGQADANGQGDANGQAGQAGQAAQPVTRPLLERRWAALAWALGGIALFFLLLRVSLTLSAASDVANNALQAWDMLHGHILLHGWILGDATYYTFELPVLALVEVFFGVHVVSAHIALALVYLIVAVFGIVIAVKDSGGISRPARAAVVVAVLAAPILVNADIWIPLGLPDHTGTTVFLLGAALLIDRAPDRRFTAPLLCLILVAGQISDVTVRYIAVPAIVLVCAYRILASRKIMTGDAANLLAAAVSFPLATWVRALMRHYGSYLMRTPQTKMAPVSQWQHNASLTWHSIRELFGALAGANAPIGTAAIFGYVCLLAVAAGVVMALWRWRSSRRADQVLVTAIVANLVVYTISTIPSPKTPHDLVIVLVCGAVLAARALVPARFASRVPALAVCGVAMVAALVPLSVVASNPTPRTPWAPLTSWLSAHGLKNGLGGYWDGSSVTVLSGNGVTVRTVQVVSGLSHGKKELTLFSWETNTLWFDPAKNYANFIVINVVHHDRNFGAEQILGKPASTYRVGEWEVLVYNKNLLRELSPPRVRRFA